MAVIAAATLWGTTGTTAHLAPAGISPMLIGAAGQALGGLLLAVAGRGSALLWRTANTGTRLILAAGAVAVAGYPLSFYPAVHRAGIAMGTVVMLGCSPVLAGLLALLVDRARPGRRWLLATGACIAGTAVLVFGGGGSAVADPVGLALAVLAGFCYAAYSTLAGRLIRRGEPSRAVIGALFGGAAVLVLPVELVAGIAWLAQPRAMAVVGWLALIATFAAYLLYGYGLRTTPATVATTLALAEPAVATLLGVLVAGDRLTGPAWAGLVVLAGGLAVLALPTARRRGTARQSRPS